MNSYTKTVVFSLFCGLLVLPAAASAASAQMLTDTFGLFTIDVTLPANTLSIELPIAASDDVEYNDRVDVIGVTVEDIDGVTADTVKTQALLLGTMPITSNNRYRIEAGETATFTLVILVEFSEPVTTQLQARVTKLPYWYNEKRTTMHQNQLDELALPTLEL